MKRPRKWSQHADLFRRLAEQYPGRAHGIAWRQALAAEPDLRETLGLSTAKDHACVYAAARNTLRRSPRLPLAKVATNGRADYRHAATTLTLPTLEPEGVNHCPRCGCNIQIVSRALALASKLA